MGNDTNPMLNIAWENLLISPFPSFSLFQDINSYNVAPYIPKSNDPIPYFKYFIINKFYIFNHVRRNSV